jgi:hypothetical protein
MYDLQICDTGDILLNFRLDDPGTIVTNIATLFLNHCQLYTLEEKPGSQCITLDLILSTAGTNTVSPVNV